MKTQVRIQINQVRSAACYLRFPDFSCCHTRPGARDFPFAPPVLPTPNMVHALSLWSSGHGNLPPSSTAACVQKTSMDQLLQKAPHDLSRARLLAVLAEESGAWLNALPNSSLGLRMDYDTIRFAVRLRLGSVLCHPHTCQHCDGEVDQLGLHGLSWKKSEGRHYRHPAPCNDICTDTI